MSNIKSQIESWVATEAQATINNYYTTSLPNLAKPTLTVKFGQKYAQVWNGTTICDLLKPASWRAPAKKSRGNILNGTASYSPYGPSYL
jgi:hypothetical protein